MKLRWWGLIVGAFATVALLGAAAHSQKSQSAPAVGPVSIEVSAKPLLGFEARDPQRRQFGPLEFRGGLHLTSSYSAFGGISSLRVEKDGERFLAVTDRGQWLRGRIRYAGSAPAGIDDVEMAPILASDGRPITARRWYDTEALTLDGGTAYVSVERVHRLLWFDYAKYGFMARGRPMRVPIEFRGLPSNKGIEGLVIVPKGLPLAGALVAISERSLDAAGNIRGFIIGGPSPGAFTVKRRDEFDVTDAALTPGGDLLILERSFSYLRGAGMQIRRIPLANVQPGSLVDGPVLIHADSGFHIDNMEGLAVHSGLDGEVVLTIVSDDNFSGLQRTLLLQFTLTEP